MDKGALIRGRQMLVQDKYAETIMNADDLAMTKDQVFYIRRQILILPTIRLSRLVQIPAEISATVPLALVSA